MVGNARTAWAATRKSGIDCSNFVNTLMAAVYQITLAGNSIQLYNQVARLGSGRAEARGPRIFCDQPEKTHFLWAFTSGERTFRARIQQQRRHDQRPAGLIG